MDARHARRWVELGLLFGLLPLVLSRGPRWAVLPTAEHALYGDFVFSVGIGGVFVNGVRLLSKVVG